MTGLLDTELPMNRFALLSQNLFGKKSSESHALKSQKVSSSFQVWPEAFIFF